jgi:restriction system protein
LHFLNQFPSFVEFRNQRHEKSVSEPDEKKEANPQTPFESFLTAYLRIRDNLAEELSQQIKTATPGFFEKLVIDLLVKMGYGGTRQDAGQAIGRSGDEGIDGIIKEDRLGLDTIYIQAKRWGSVVGRPEIHKFAGALQGQRAKKGIFITTSSYTKEAEAFANQSSDPKIILIDGEKLVNLMIDNNVGISIDGNYELKKIDSDYFAEE